MAVPIEKYFLSYCFLKQKYNIYKIISRNLSNILWYQCKLTHSLVIVALLENQQTLLISARSFLNLIINYHIVK